MATATRPCEKAASILTEALFKGMKAPIKEYITEEMNKNLVKSFKTMKDDFLEEVAPKLYDAKESIAKISKEVGEDKINSGSSMLLYYAASNNIDDMGKFLAKYKKDGHDLLATHISKSKSNEMEAMLTYEGKITEQIVASFRSAIFSYTKKGGEEGQEQLDVLYRKEAA
ncbi:MAG: hypothetical protein NTY68_03795 [Candidatus Micrarchaeota archaeon]|nr:hypothetical protein [Candidatus Micrarchaeota archaeon]